MEGSQIKQEEAIYNDNRPQLAVQLYLKTNAKCNRMRPDCQLFNTWARMVLNCNFMDKYQKTMQPLYNKITENYCCKLQFKITLARYAHSELGYLILCRECLLVPISFSPSHVVSLYFWTEELWKGRRREGMYIIITFPWLGKGREENKGL